MKFWIHSQNSSDMIAKAKSIAHGSVSLNYITRFGKAPIVKLNFLPKDVEGEAYWYHMQANNLKHADRRSRNRPIKNDMIRIEISPSQQETEGWTLEDWRMLLVEFVSEFDAIDLSQATGRKTASGCNVAGSQYVATLHKDSRSGILHMHLDCNRIDTDGCLNDDHDIGMRAVMAANRVAANRGWVQAEQRADENRREISGDCMSVLKEMKSFSWEEFNRRMAARGYDLRFRRDNDKQVRGYTVRKGNSIYKSSELGRSRNLMPSRIQETWKELHPSKPKQLEPVRSVKDTVQRPPAEPAAIKPRMAEYEIMKDDINLKLKIPYDEFKILQEECGWTYILTDELSHIVNTAILLYAGYVDAATSVATGCGGGGSEPSSDWGRDEKEDEREWARRCARMARKMVSTRKRTYKR